jgi:16S rRNA (uracil1498-N3)-methyltransferase
MSVPRFHVDADIGVGDVGREVALPDAAAHHALRVLRLATGDALTLFTGGGGEFTARLVRAEKRDAGVRLDAFSAVEREPALSVTLVQGIPANDAMDFVVRRAVELGVAAVQPVIAARGARFPSDERGRKRLAHWRQIAVSACEQCGRNRVPPVHDGADLDAWLAARAAARPGIVLDPAARIGIDAVPTPASSIDLLVGPEGGFTSDEVARATRAGFTPVRIGPRILRTETASLAALAAIHTLWGDFR